MTIQMTTLPNGLRVMTDTVKAVDSVALGVWCAVGTRHETMDVNGVAHMVEHMLFKGTKTRDAAKIAEEIEDAGGNINAYTSRDITAYHIHALKEHTALAVNILGDILQNSTLPADEIERERQVIIQEIGMYMDTPDDLVFDHYQRTAYPGQPIGASILGTPDIISGMGEPALSGYIQKFYTPSNLVISASGNVDHDDLVRMVQTNFTHLPQDQPFTAAPAAYTGGEHRQGKDLEQSHIVMGFQSINRHDPRYYSAIALSSILGGGMSSRLFQEIREKRGLVYSVASFHSAYADDGQFIFYAGTGPDKLRELMPVLCDEIRKIAANPVTADELKRAKTQMRSNLLMAREGMMTRAGQQAKHQIYYGDILSIDRLLADIDAVSIQSIRDLAEDIFAGAPTLSALGPLDELESYDQIRNRLAA